MHTTIWRSYFLSVLNNIPLLDTVKSERGILTTLACDQKSLFTKGAYHNE